jgi:NAD(P)-dependent dehydrogenase (short-subunit alcohol dehydrogenase family)
MLNQPLTGKVALITGAGSGIGEATAKLLSQQGATIAAIDHKPNESEKIARAIRDLQGNIACALADVSDPEQVEKAVYQLVNQLGRLDIVFINAGINGVWAPIEDLTPEEWDKTLNVNLKGTFLTLKFTVPYLKQQQGGAIVMTASVNGTRVFSNTGATAYACSKAAQVALAKMVALELSDHAIRVNVICPGEIRTGINDSTQRRNLDWIGDLVTFPKGRIPLTRGNAGTAEQVAQLVLFLVSDAASHITGTEIWIDGGESLLQG